MYYHLVCSPEFFSLAYGRKSTRKIFASSNELMVLIHHEFAGSSISPLFAFFSCPFHMGISIPLGKRLIGVFLGTQGCGKLKSKSCANANFVYL